MLVVSVLSLSPRRKFIDTRYLNVIFPTFVFIILYSGLGHKELRFLFPVIPGLNLLVALGTIKMYFLYSSRFVYKNNVVNVILFLGMMGALLFNCIYSGLALYISHNNYPGADAILRLTNEYQKLIELDSHMPFPHIHMDVYAA